MNIVQLFFRNILMVTLVLICISGSAQINISGRLMDEKTEEPVVNARLYFDNTTIVARSKNDGSFDITVPQSLNTTLIIAAAGYEILSYKSNFASDKKYVFKLQVKDSLPGRLIMGDEFKNKWLIYFKGQILGASEEADNCILKNIDKVYFTAGEKGSFWYYADTPLIIINKMLGYKITLDIAEGLYNEATGQHELIAFTLYEDLASENKKKYLANRKDCYEGSSLHFYRSLLSNQLLQDGFNVFYAKEPAKDFVANTLKDSLLLALGTGEFIPINASEILYIDSTNNLSIRTQGKLLVQYGKNPGSKNYLALKGLSEGFLDKGIECYISFKKTPTGISSAGFLTDISGVEYHGYWIFEKLGNNLPYDYKAE